MSESAKRHEENSILIKEIRASTDAAIQNQGASIKTLEIQITQMSKVLQERGFGSLPSSTKANPRDQVKLIWTTIEADSYPIRCIGSSQYAVSTGQNRTLMYETRQTRILFPSHLNGASVSVMPLSTYFINNLDSTYLWHCHLAHISKKRIEKLQQEGLLRSTDDELFDQCVSCLSGKMTRKSFPHRPERATDLLGIIHTDVCGSLRHVSRQCASYFIILTDDYSRYGYVYLLKHKYEVFETFKVFKNEVENQLGKTIKALRSDRDMVRSMMNLTTLPLSFWDYALKSATRILNMVPTKKVDKTPYELWYGKVPNLSYLKVWGCETLVKWDTPEKLQQRSVKCIFIGYPKETMSYYFYFPPENKIVIARYAEFFEKNLITQEVSGRAIDLEEIQDEDTSPSKITREIPMEVKGFKPPQEEVISSLVLSECLGYVLPQDLSVGLILNGLTSDFAGFVRNYNMHNMGKTIGELHAMLIKYEKAKGKGKANGKGKYKQVYIPKPTNPKPSAKEHPAKDDTCHQCKEVGHWKRNCHVYLVELLKKKKQVGTASSSGKMTRKPFLHSTKRATDLLGLIHTDVCGLLRHVSRQVENQLRKTIKTLRSDQGGEYISQELKDYLKACGIVQQLTPPYTPQHNESTTCILNMVPTKKVDKTPYEIWYGKVPNLSYLKVWGCEVLVKRDMLDKLQQRSEGRSLKEIQDEDTSPSEITSEIPMEVEGFEPPQQEVILIRRSERTHRAPNRLCLNIEAEEHSIGDLNKPTSYKAAILDPEFGKWIDTMNAEMQSMIAN
ncbi:retrotransposon protein, putative, ty1-copia subclass [Tanacetum coccineum]